MWCSAGSVVCGCLCRIEQIGTLGQDYRHGAGVLDIQFDSEFTLLTCGYDTIIRLWDLRASLRQWYIMCDALSACAVYKISTGWAHFSIPY